jgi:hypothetical protein
MLNLGLSWKQLEQGNRPLADPYILLQRFPSFVDSEGLSHAQEFLFVNPGSREKYFLILFSVPH